MRESYFLLWLPHHRKGLGLDPGCGDYLPYLKKVETVLQDIGLFQRAKLVIKTLLSNHSLSLASALIDQRTQIAAARADLISYFTTLLLNCVDNSLRSHTYLTSYFINSTLYVADSVLKLSSRTVQRN